MELRYRGRVVAVRPKADVLEVELDTGEILRVPAAAAPQAWPGVTVSAPDPQTPKTPPPRPADDGRSGNG